MSDLLRLDSWINALTGLGTLRDKLTHSRMVPGARLADQTLEALYNGDDLAQKICDKVPREATRRGFTLEIDGVDSDEGAKTARDIVDAAARLGVLPALRLGWIWGRVYGAGAVLVGADDGQQDMRMPLDEQRIREIGFLTVLAKPQLTIAKRYSNPAERKFGEPELYSVHRTMAQGGIPAQMLSSAGAEVHESRLIVFGGALTARCYTPTPDGFDDSVLQRVHNVLRETATTWQSTAHLVTDASQGVLKIDGLVNLIAAKGKEALQTRVEIMDMARSVCRAILVDAERESFERVATSFAGLPDMMDRFMQRAASAAEMPATVLWGRSPAGMNATGESDTRGWYDTVQDAQTDVLLPRLERALTLLMLAQQGPTKGKLPDTWRVCFNALWQPTDKERADTRKVNADAVVALVDAQIMLPEEAALDLAQSGEFPTLDPTPRQKALKADYGDDADADPNANPEPEPGAPPIDPNAPPGDDNVQQQALNGAQVTALTDVIHQVAIEELPRSSGIAILVHAFNVEPDEAEAMMGEVGRTFKIDKPVPPAAPAPGVTRPPVPPRPGTPPEG